MSCALDMNLESIQCIVKLSRGDDHDTANHRPSFETSPCHTMTCSTGKSHPNYPMQLSTCLLKLDYSHPIPLKLCTIKDYGSTANPTSTPSAMSQYMSQWRSVARWETNGADLSLERRPVQKQTLIVPLNINAFDQPAAEEAAMAMRPIPKPRKSLMKPSESSSSLPTDSSVQSELVTGM